ncbi:MAG: hypothetical protein ACP5OR_02970, partial [Candidatus Dormibacteria bacterium]
MRFAMGSESGPSTSNNQSTVSGRFIISTVRCFPRTLHGQSDYCTFLIAATSSVSVALASPKSII